MKLSCRLVGCFVACMWVTTGTPGLQVKPDSLQRNAVAYFISSQYNWISVNLAIKEGRMTYINKPKSVI